MIEQGYAAECYSGKWLWADEDGVFRHQGESSWPMRSGGWFFPTQDEAEKIVRRRTDDADNRMVHLAKMAVYNSHG